MKVHLTGVLNHGFESSAGCYVLGPTGKSYDGVRPLPVLTLVLFVAGTRTATFNDETLQMEHSEALRIGKDTDYQLTVALESIIRRLSSLPPEKRPPTLFLQMDNASSECKNKYMIAFACWLIYMGIFTEVVFGFLLVGHTHEDVDQMFSQFSRWLCNNNVLTFQQFLEGVGLQYHNKRVKAMAAKAGMSEADIAAKSTTRVFEVEHVLGVKKWISGHINPKFDMYKVCSRTIAYDWFYHGNILVRGFFQGYQEMKFFKEPGTGEVRMQGRHRSTHEWGPVVRPMDSFPAPDDLPGFNIPRGFDVDEVLKVRSYAIVRLSVMMCRR